MAEEDIYVSVKAEEAGLRALQTMSATLINLVNQIDAQANAARASVRAQTDLNKAFGYGSDGARVYAKSLSEVRRNSIVIDQYLNQNNRQLKILQRSFGQAGKEAKKFSDETVRNLSRIQKQASQIRLTQQIQDFKSLSRAVLNVGKNMQYVGRNLTIGLTFPIISFLRFGLDSFKKLENEIIRFEKIASDAFVTNQKLYSQFNKELDDISFKYGVARELVQGIASDFATVGIPETAISDLVRLSAEVEKLGDVSMEESRQFVQSLLFQALTVQRSTDGVVDYGLAVEQVTGQLAMFNAIENNTVVTMQMVAKAIPEMQAVTTQFGLSLNEATAAFAPMIAAGFEVGASGNSIKVSLQRLVAPAKQNREILEELAQSIGGFNFEVGVGIESVSELARSFVQLEKTKGAQGALELYARLFGVRQGSRMLQAFKELSYFQEELSDTSSGSFRVINTIVENVNKSVEAAGLSQRYQATSIAELSQISRDAADAYASGNTVLLDAIESGQNSAVEILEAGGKKLTDEIDSQAGRILALQAAGRGKSAEIYTAELERALESPVVKLARAREQFKRISRELVPPLVDALESLIPHIKRFADFIQGLNATTIRNITLMLGLAAAVGPVITAFSNLLQTAGFLAGALTRVAGGLSMLFGKSGQILPAAMFEGIDNLDVFGKKLSRLNEGFYYYAGSTRKLNKEMEKVAKTGSRVFGADFDDAIRKRMRRRRLFEDDPGRKGFFRSVMSPFFGAVERQRGIERFPKIFKQAIKDANENLGKFFAAENKIKNVVGGAADAIDKQSKKTRRKAKATSDVKKKVDDFTIVEKKSKKVVDQASDALGKNARNVKNLGNAASLTTTRLRNLTAAQRGLINPLRANYGTLAGSRAPAVPPSQLALPAGPSRASIYGSLPRSLEVVNRDAFNGTKILKKNGEVSANTLKKFNKALGSSVGVLSAVSAGSFAAKARSPIEVALESATLGSGTDDDFVKLLRKKFNHFDDEVMRALFTRAGRLDDFSREVRAVSTRPSLVQRPFTPYSIKQMLDAVRGGLFAGGNVAEIMGAKDLPRALRSSNAGRGVQGTQLGKSVIAAVNDLFAGAGRSRSTTLNPAEISAAVARSNAIDSLMADLPYRPRVPVSEMIPGLERDLEVAKFEDNSSSSRALRQVRETAKRVKGMKAMDFASGSEQERYRLLGKRLEVQRGVLKKIGEAHADSLRSVDERIATVDRQISQGKRAISESTFLSKDSKYSTEKDRATYRRLKRNIVQVKKALKKGSIAQPLASALLKNYETQQRDLLDLGRMRNELVRERMAVQDRPVAGLGSRRNVSAAISQTQKMIGEIESNAEARRVRISNLYERALYDRSRVFTVMRLTEDTKKARSSLPVRGRGIGTFGIGPRFIDRIGDSVDQESQFRLMKGRSFFEKGARAPLLSLKELTLLASSKIEGIKEIMLQTTEFDDIVQRELNQARAVMSRAGMPGKKIKLMMGRIVSDLTANLAGFAGSASDFERLVKNSITRTTMGGTSMMAGGRGVDAIRESVKASVASRISSMINEATVEIGELGDEALIQQGLKEKYSAEGEEPDAVKRRAASDAEKRARKSRDNQQLYLDALRQRLNNLDDEFFDDAIRQVESGSMEEGSRARKAQRGQSKVSKAADVTVRAQENIDRVIMSELGQVRDELRAAAAAAEGASAPVTAASADAVGSLFDISEEFAQEVLQISDAIQEAAASVEAVGESVEASVAASTAETVDSLDLFGDVVDEISDTVRSGSRAIEGAGEAVEAQVVAGMGEVLVGVERVGDSVDEVSDKVKIAGAAAEVAGELVEVEAVKSTNTFVLAFNVIRDAIKDSADGVRNMAAAVKASQVLNQVATAGASAQAVAAVGGAGGGGGILGTLGAAAGAAGGAAGRGAAVAGGVGLSGLQKLLGLFKSLNSAVISFGLFALKAFAVFTVVLGPVVVAIGALVVAFRNLFKASQGSEELRARLKKAFEGIKRLLMGLVKPFADAINGFFGIDTSSHTAGASLKTLSSVILAVAEYLGRLADQLANSEGFKSFQTAATNAITQIINILLTMGKLFKNIVTGDMNAAGDAFVQIFMRVGYFILGVLDDLEGAFVAFGKFVVNVNAAAFKLVVRIVVEAFKALWNAIKNIDWAGLAVSIGKTLYNGIVGGLKGIAKGFVSDISERQDIADLLLEQGKLTPQEYAELFGTDALEDVMGGAVANAVSSAFDNADYPFDELGFKQLEDMELDFSFSSGIDSLDNLIDSLVATGESVVEGIVGTLMSAIGEARNSIRESFFERFGMDIEAPIRLVSDDTATAIQEIVSEINAGIANALDQGGESLSDDISDAVGDAMNDAFQKFADLVTDYLGEQIDKIKDSFKSALEAQRDQALSFFDDQIEAIEALEEAEERLYKKQRQIEEDRQRERDRALQKENYRRDRALAIYEGRVDDARMFDLQEVKNSQDFAETTNRITRDRLREEQKYQRDILKDILKEQKNAAKETFDEIIDQFVEYVEEIGDLGTLNQEELEAQFQAIAAQADIASSDMVDAFRGYYTELPALIEMHTDPTVGFFGESLDKLLVEAKNKFGIGREIEDTTTILGTTAVMLGDMGALVSAASLDADFATALSRVPTSISDAFTADGEDTILGNMSDGIDQITQIIEDFDPEGIMEDAFENANEALSREYAAMVSSTNSAVSQLVDGLDPLVAQLIAVEAAANAAGGAVGSIPDSAGGGGPSPSPSYTDIQENAQEIVSSFSRRALEEAPSNFAGQIADRVVQYTNLLSSGKTRQEAYDQVKSGIGLSILRTGFVLYARRFMPDLQYSKGGMVPYANGGMVPFGNGGMASYANGGFRVPGFDSTGVPALLHGGEYVINAKAVKNIGIATLQSLNDMRFNTPGRRMSGQSVTNVNTTNTTNIYVENFIGEDEWFRTMLKEYNIKHKQIDDRRYGITDPVYRTYKGASFN